VAWREKRRLPSPSQYKVKFKKEAGWEVDTHLSFSRRLAPGPSLESPLHSVFLRKCDICLCTVKEGRIAARPPVTVLLK
jgi:hypothetical protein